MHRVPGETQRPRDAHFRAPRFLFLPHVYSAVPSRPHLAGGESEGFRQAQCLETLKNKERFRRCGAP